MIWNQHLLYQIIDVWYHIRKRYLINNEKKDKIKLNHFFLQTAPHNRVHFWGHIVCLVFPSMFVWTRWLIWPDLFPQCCSSIERVLESSKMCSLESHAHVDLWTCGNLYLTFGLNYCLVSYFSWFIAFLNYFLNFSIWK